jgi:hypothetical protein
VVSACHNCCTALQGDNIHWDITAGIGAIAELTKVIVAPAPHTTFRRDRASMGDTRCDRVVFTACHRDETSE